jgi:hypothetical protein
MKMLRTVFAVAVTTMIASHALFAVGLPTTPEIDPGMGLGALAFLGGAVMVIRGRRKA